MSTGPVQQMDNDNARTTWIIDTQHLELPEAEIRSFTHLFEKSVILCFV